MKGVRGSSSVGALRGPVRKEAAVQRPQKAGGSCDAPCPPSRDTVTTPPTARGGVGAGCDRTFYVAPDRGCVEGRTENPGGQDIQRLATATVSAATISATTRWRRGSRPIAWWRWKGKGGGRCAPLGSKRPADQRQGSDHTADDQRVGDGRERSQVLPMPDLCQCAEDRVYSEDHQWQVLGQLV